MNTTTRPATAALAALLAAALLAGCSSDRACVDAHESAAIARTRVERMPASDADFALASPFSDHMVLQRDCTVPVWGTGAPGEKSTGSFRSSAGRGIVSAASSTVSKTSSGTNRRLSSSSEFS